MVSLLKLFRKAEDGYVLVLSLILIPVFLGFGLLIIDVGRGNNAQADLSAAADAVALAGARELDGSANAITNARAAMANLTNSVSMLGRQAPDMEISLVYEDIGGNEFTVVFLRGIPGSSEAGTNNTIPGDDTSPINNAFLTTYGTTDPALAQYVWVMAQSRNLSTAFINPANLLPSSVPVAATAVAKTFSATCNLTPLYICNPFEATAGYSGPGLQERFQEGALHGRLLRLHPKGNGTHTPGNFGFLQVEGENGNTSASANTLRQIFAGRRNGTCYQAGQVTTKPGAAVSISQGINTKFDIWTGPFSGYRRDANNNDFEIYPAVNVRKGYKPGSGNLTQSTCGARASDDHIGNADGILDGVYGFPDNVSMAPPGLSIPGATVGSGDWDLTTYWQRNFGTAPPQALLNSASFTGQTSNTNLPSRYDTYRFEIDNNPTYVPITSVAPDNNGNPGRESGQPNCGLGQNPTAITPRADPDPRLIYAAIIDCNDPNSIAQGGGINTYNVNSYAELFMVRPMGRNGNGGPSTPTTYIDSDGNPYTVSDATIDIEIVRVTGAGANGVLENFVRNESVLVR